jgi:hypothetical protein
MAWTCVMYRVFHCASNVMVSLTGDLEVRPVNLLCYC